MSRPDLAARRSVELDLGMPFHEAQSLGAVEHAYTHFTVTAHAFVCDVGAGNPESLELEDLRWVGPNELTHLAMGKIDRSIAELLSGG